MSLNLQFLTTDMSNSWLFISNKALCVAEKCHSKEEAT